MAFITGATVDFTDFSAPGTPRVLNVPDAWGDVLRVQDVWDTLTSVAVQLENHVYKKLINRPASGGKNFLRTGKLVGVTLQMNNVKVKFEDLPGPAYTIKEVVDGNLTAVDHLGATLEPMESSTFINWKLESDVSGAIVSGGDAASIATAVWTRALEGAVTAEELTRVVLAALSGLSTVQDLGGGLKRTTYKSLDGLTSRVTVDHDAAGVRSVSVVDGG